MAKKSPEVMRIEEEMTKEFENYKAKILPKYQKKARGKLRRLQKSLNKIKPLKIKAANVSKTEKDLKTKLVQVQNQTPQSKKKIASDRTNIKNYTQEIKRLKKEIPLLEKNVKMLLKIQVVVAKKHKKTAIELSKLHKKVMKLEKRKEKIAHNLQKYFQ